MFSIRSGLLPSCFPFVLTGTLTPQKHPISWLESATCSKFRTAGYVRQLGSDQKLLTSGFVSLGSYGVGQLEFGLQFFLIMKFGAKVQGQALFMLTGSIAPLTFHFKSRWHLVNRKLPDIAISLEFWTGPYLFKFTMSILGSKGTSQHKKLDLKVKILVRWMALSTLCSNILIWQSEATSTKFMTVNNVRKLGSDQMLFCPLSESSRSLGAGQKNMSANSCNQWDSKIRLRIKLLHHWLAPALPNLADP